MTRSSRISRIRRNLKSFFRTWKTPQLLRLSFYWKILSWPVRRSISMWKKGRVRNLILGVPAVVCMAMICWLSAASRIQEENTSSRYWSRAQNAIRVGETSTAHLLLNRILQEDSGHVEDAKLALAGLLESNGQKERAEALFRMLAPTDKRGFPQAHERLAILLAPRINERTSAEELRTFQWHLNAAGKTLSPGLSMAWGRYSLAIGDAEAARKHFRVAVESYPEILVELGNIEAYLDNREAAQTTFRRAVSHLDGKVKAAPKDHISRAGLAQSYLKLGEFRKAQITLEEGLMLDPDRESDWKWLLAGIYVNYHDLLQAEGKPISLLLDQLSKALSVDPNRADALQRLMSYAEAKVEGNAELRTILSRVLASSETPALAHMALGNLCWKEGDRESAARHFEFALDQRMDVPTMLNNMAWMLAHSPTDPDYDRAMAMVNAALETSPNNPRYLDTRGTIHLKQQQWRLALKDLERAINGLPDKAKVHQNLALIYDELKMPEVATQHRELAVEAANSVRP